MSQDNLERFEKYFRNELNPKELEDFEHNLSNDITFRKEFDSYNLMLAGIRSNALEEKLNLLKNHASTKTQGRKTDSIGDKLWWAVCLIGILVSALIYFGVQNYDNKDTQEIKIENQINDIPEEINSEVPMAQEVIADTLQITPKEVKLPESVKDDKPRKDQKIYANNSKVDYLKEALKLYIKPENLAIIYRAAPDNATSAQQKALSEFYNNNYSSAVNILQGTDDDKELYLLAHALLLTGEHKKASNIFRELGKDDFTMYHEDSKWYLALSLIAQLPASKAEIQSLVTELKSTPKYKNSVDNLLQLIQ